MATWDRICRKYNQNIKFIECPFTGERLAAIPAIRPDVTVIHAQKADRKGNVLIWGVVGVQKEAVMAAKRVIVTVEEIVDDLNAPPNAVVLPQLGDRRGLRSEGRRLSVLCARLLPAQQRLLQAVGPHRARTRDLSGLDAKARARHQGLR